MVISAMITLIPLAMAIFLYFLLRGVDLTTTPSDYDDVVETEEKAKREELDDAESISVKSLKEEHKNSIDSCGHV